MCSKPQPQLDKKQLGAFATKSVYDPSEVLMFGNECSGAMPETCDSLRMQDAAGWSESLLTEAGPRPRTDESLRQSDRTVKECEDRIESGNTFLRKTADREHRQYDLIGNSTGLRRVLEMAEQVAPTDATVLLLGETGTGKELISRKIHELSRRSKREMVKVNCAALPAELVESELFGRERGAFTGALSRELGRFELANGSTILLDEIAELPLALQAKLLRVLQEGEFERLGNPRTIKVDIRVIGATNRNLAEAVRAGRFREDLFYRLSVFPVTIPPLRERREDIPSLVWHFVHEFSRQMGRNIESIETSTMEALTSHSWPGNIRELRNVIERFMITNTDTVFRVDLPLAGASLVKARPGTLEEAERNHILGVLKSVDWRVRGEGGASEILRVKATTLESQMKRLGIARAQ